MRKKLWGNVKNIIIVVLLLAVIFGGWLEYRRYRRDLRENPPSEQTPIVLAQTPQRQNVVVTHEYIGKVQAINGTTIVPFISGYITEINAVGGQEVKKGTTLITLKQDEYKASLMSAYAEILSANADLTNAESQYRRLEKAGLKAVSQTELDTARATYLTAQAKLKQAEAAYYTARINYDYTFLKAPFDGILGNIAASVGDYITPADNALLSVVQYDPIRVVFSVTDREFLTAKEKGEEFYANDVIKLVLPTGKIYDEAGKIMYAANEVDKTTNSVAVYAEFSNSKRELIPESYVKVLLRRRYADVVLLGKEYVVFKDDGQYVYFAKDNVLTLKKVEIVADYDNNYVLTNDFDEGFIVLEDADERLLGQKVEVKTAAKEK